MAVQMIDETPAVFVSQVIEGGHVDQKIEIVILFQEHHGLQKSPPVDGVDVLL